MWSLVSEKDNIRTYRSETNSQCTQRKCYTDMEGNNWFEFEDLAAMPFARTFAASKISSLFSLGITSKDADVFFADLKTILRSKDNGEKYEQAYGKLLEFENNFKSATDPVKQMTSLVCVYFTINDEPIDSFADKYQIPKLSLLEADPQMHNFFLQRQIELIERSQTFLNQLSQIASQ